jgi:dihydrofolate reductase
MPLRIRHTVLHQIVCACSSSWTRKAQSSQTQDGNWLPWLSPRSPRIYAVHFHKAEIWIVSRKCWSSISAAFSLRQIPFIIVHHKSTEVQLEYHRRNIQLPRSTCHNIDQ